MTMSMMTTKTTMTMTVTFTMSTMTIFSKQKSISHQNVNWKSKNGNDDNNNIYIMMKCVFVCLSRKMITSELSIGGAKRDARFGLVMMMMMLMIMVMMRMMLMVMMMMLMRMMTQPALTEAVASLLKRNTLSGRASEPIVVARLHLKRIRWLVFEMFCFHIWALSVMARGGGVNACPDGLKHFFSTSKWAISCFRGMLARMVCVLFSSFWQCHIKYEKKGSERSAPLYCARLTGEEGGS